MFLVHKKLICELLNQIISALNQKTKNCLVDRHWSKMTLVMLEMRKQSHINKLLQNFIVTFCNFKIVTFCKFQIVLCRKF